MTKEPVHQLHMPIFEGHQERGLASLVACLEGGTLNAHILLSPLFTLPHLCVCTMFGQHHSYLPVALLAGQEEWCAALLCAALNVSVP